MSGVRPASVSTSSLHSDDSSYTVFNEGVVFEQFKLADVPKLKSIFFAVFDNYYGPKIKFQVPAEVVTDKKFLSFSPAIIPKKELLNKLIKINLVEYNVIGYPIMIQSQMYEREKLMFNLCFVVDKETNLDCVYEPIVQKCAQYLRELEQECQFVHNLVISKSEDSNFPGILLQIFDDLNSRGTCLLNVEGTMTSMYLKLCPSYRGIEPPKISQYMVPMFIRQVDLFEENGLIDRMDVLSQKIIPKIDGVRCILEIAHEVDIDPDLVSRCVRNLYFYELVDTVPLFLYSNTYVATEKLHNFYCNELEKQMCLEFVRIRDDKNEKLPMPLFSDVFRLYMSLKADINLVRWCEEMQPRTYNVDERRFIQFGMHRKFLRKLSIYPISVSTCSNETESRIVRLCNGTNSLEDLAIVYRMAPDDLLQILQESKKFALVSK
ncbi:unnamed protein product [Auanema sp. JU1783]|nr:unnamed protein product [Auanema sp. JU1783]